MPYGRSRVLIARTVKNNSPGKRLWRRRAGASDERHQGRRKVPQNLHRKRTGEAVRGRLRAGNEGGDGPEEAISDHEHERPRAIDDAGFDHPSAFRKAREPVIARAGLSTHFDGSAVGKRHHSGYAPRGPFLHDADQLLFDYRHQG